MNNDANKLFFMGAAETEKQRRMPIHIGSLSFQSFAIPYDFCIRYSRIYKPIVMEEARECDQQELLPDRYDKSA